MPHPFDIFPSNGWETLKPNTSMEDPLSQLVPSTPRWRLRDFLAAAALFLATAAVVLWQNAHLAVLWDLSYVLDSSARIAAGQMPYRDFPFAHAPLTFLIQAAIMRLTGRVYFYHVLYVAAIGGLGTVLAWRIALRTLRGHLASPWAVSLALAAPLTVLGLYSILPHPSYDCDCAFSVLLGVLLLQRLTPSENTAPSASPKYLASLFAGTAIALPLFFKQNMGLPLLGFTVAAIVLLLVAKVSRFHGFGQGSFLLSHPSRKNKNAARVGHPAQAGSDELGASGLSAILAGMGATLVVAVLLIHSTAGLGNYLRWTIQFAAQRRLPGYKDMLAVYLQPSLLWMLPCVAAALLLLCYRGRALWSQLAALALLSAPFLWTVASLFVFDDADERGDTLLALWPFLLILSAALTLFHLWLKPGMRTLLPAIVLVAINGTLLSQQLWGSTHAIWPLLTLFIAELIASLSALTQADADSSGATQRGLPIAAILAMVIAGTLLVCGGFYTASEERLSYVQLPDEPAIHATLPQLAGMATPGPWLPNFEELLRFAAAKIPLSDGIILLPGEDPFYFATGRVPQFPVLLFDPTTDPYSPEQTCEVARARNIHWLVVKRELQIKDDPMPQREATLSLLLRDFTLDTRLQGYDVYRRF